MILRWTRVLVTLFSTTANLFAQPPCNNIVHLGFIYPLSTNGTAARQYTNTISFHALAGVSGSERALCASGITNVIYDHATGLVAAGFSNHVLGSCNGVMAAGFLNTLKNEVKGVQAAGFLNIAGSMRGAQLGGFANVAGNVKGIQAAGFINCARDVNTQVAGFINVAGRVKGVQLAGFINVADSSDYPIGVINIIRKGEKAIGVTADETGTVLLALRSGGKVLYGILGAGLNMKRDTALYALQVGMGAHLKVNWYFRINVEATTMALTDFDEGVYQKSSISVLPSLRMGRSFELFAGPSFSYTGSPQGKWKNIDQQYVWSNTYYGYFNGLSFGGYAGLQVHF